jgi:NADH-quinone oxidoreductase subunit E
VSPRRKASIPHRDPFASPGGWAIGPLEADGPGATAGATPVAPPAPPTAATPPPAGPDERARKRERVIDVLWELQRARGWLDDEAIRTAAQECALTPQEVDEVATFYNLLLRRPAGRTTIFVCDSISCALNGADRLIDSLGQTLGIRPGEVTKDGAFGLLPIVCLGHCERAPCLLAGDSVHGPCATDSAAAAALVEKLRRG